MEKTDIAALLDALCERPLADGQRDGQAEGAAQLQAFCRAAAKVLSQGDAAPTGSGTPAGADTDRLTAALAALVSGADAESARRTLEEAMLRSPAARLDAQSALAFIDALAQSPQAAPAHLVEELLTADRAAAAGAMPRQDAGRPGLWALIAGASWSARRWRMAAACTILLVGGAASWSTYWQRMHPAAGDPAQPMAKTTSEPPASAQAPALVRAPAPAKPALATAPPCDTRSKVSDAAKAETGLAAGAAKPAESSAEANCAAEPQLADRPADTPEAHAARLRAEADRQAAAAAARAAAGAASNVDAARADRSGPGFDAIGRGPPPAAAGTAPAATPATRPSAPAGVR